MPLCHAALCCAAPCCAVRCAVLCHLLTPHGGAHPIHPPPPPVPGATWWRRVPSRSSARKQLLARSVPAPLGPMHSMRSMGPTRGTSGAVGSAVAGAGGSAPAARTARAFDVTSAAIPSEASAAVTVKRGRPQGGGGPQEDPGKGFGQQPEAGAAAVGLGGTAFGGAGGGGPPMGPGPGGEVPQEGFGSGAYDGEGLEGAAPGGVCSDTLQEYRVRLLSGTAPG